MREEQERTAAEDDLVAAVARARKLSPQACRARVEAGFSGAAMVRGYEAVYERLTKLG